MGDFTLTQFPITIFLSTCRLALVKMTINVCKVENVSIGDEGLWRKQVRIPVASKATQDTTKTAKTRPKIKWACEQELEQVIEIPTLSDYSYEERSSIWFSRDDYQVFRLEARKKSRLIREHFAHFTGEIEDVFSQVKALALGGFKEVSLVQTPDKLQVSGNINFVFWIQLFNCFLTLLLTVK
jgi:hypothetical protein